MTQTAEQPEETQEGQEGSVDLFEILTKPLSEMTDDELIHAIETIRTMRKVRMNRGKGKSALDVLLSRLNPEMARKLLQQLEAQDAAKKE